MIILNDFKLDIDLEIESERGHRTALHIAASKGYHGIVKLLLEPKLVCTEHCYFIWLWYND